MTFSNPVSFQKSNSALMAMLQSLHNHHVHITLYFYNLHRKISSMKCQSYNISIREINTKPHSKPTASSHIQRLQQNCILSFTKLVHMSTAIQSGEQETWQKPSTSTHLRCILSQLLTNYMATTTGGTTTNKCTFTSDDDKSSASH